MHELRAEAAPCLLRKLLKDTVSPCLKLTKHFLHLSYSLRDFRHQTQHFASDRQEQVTKASKGLETIAPARARRATLADYQTRVDEVLSGLARVRKENDKSALGVSLCFY